MHKTDKQFLMKIQPLPWDDFFCNPI
jgi:hypothetical protein